MGNIDNNEIYRIRMSYYDYSVLSIFSEKIKNIANLVKYQELQQKLHHLLLKLEIRVNNNIIKLYNNNI